MSNFKNYKEAIEFHKDNHPIQTRKVLIEISNYQGIQQRNILNEYHDRVMNAPRTSQEESDRFLEERKKYISTMLYKSSFEYGGPSYEFCWEEYNKNTINDDLSSDWLAICELF